MHISYIALQNSGEKFSCMIHADILEFKAAKFNLHLAFVQLFMGPYWLKIKIHIVFIMSLNYL